MYTFKEILIIESERNSDISMMKKAFDLLTTKYKLNFINDETEAMTFLNKVAKNSKFNHSIILLDSDLPSKSSIKLLKKIKQNDKLKYIPVIIINTLIEEVTN